MSTTTRPRATKKYKALIAAGVNDAEALNILGVTVEQAGPEVDPRIATLIQDGLFTVEQAERIIAGDGSTKKKGKKGKGKKAKAEAPVELTPKQVAEALVAERGMTFARGRVYVTPAIIEALARVTKNGKAEVVQASGVGRVAAVLVYKETSGDVAVQNLAKPV